MSGLTSVIIPCYNGEEYLTQALLSLAAQTVTPLEIIVVDDGSSKPLDFPTEWGGPPLKIIRQLNKGLAAARNRGILEAKGAYVAFLDADDYWHQDKIAEEEYAFRQNPSAVACYSRCVHSPGFFGFGPYPPDNVDDDEFLLVLWYTSFFPPSAVSVRRIDIEAVGRFREGMGNGEDIELWMRLLTRGPFVQISKNLCYYRQHSGQLTKNIFKKIIGGKEARAAILQQHSDRLILAGLRNDRLWDAYRNDILLTYYRRQFYASRPLLFDYCKDHPFDFEMWFRLVVTLFPSWLVTIFRGRIDEGSTSTNTIEDNSLGWDRLVRGLQDVIREDSPLKLRIAKCKPQPDN